MRTWMFVVVALALNTAARRADAYPQWQLAREMTCTGCHISPDGAGLLNENGTAVASAVAWKDYNPEFAYGKVPAPGWLQLGGDLRGAAGFVDPGFANGAGYPMQAEVSARAATHGFSVFANGGFRRPSEDPNASVLHVLWSREHYVMWQQKPDEGMGLFVRVGHLSPTYGLRLAEHIVYTQQYGGRPLYDEEYAASVSFVKREFEVHGAGFVHDPYGTPNEKGDGGALYAEARLGTHAAVGAEGKYSKADEQTRMFGGITGKLYLAGPDVMLMGEAELIQQKLAVGGDKANKIAAYVLGSRPLPHGLTLDVGVGHYTQDTRVKGLYRDCIDVNLHWFADPHFELLWTNRLELLGDGGPNGGYSLAQLHVRL
ncbi:MAG TPA: hypothetical protein VLB44_27600 [Kofleriaceae bacterium]|nr:hypothetical protein [Kofleriaceae bacterium]